MTKRLLCVVGHPDDETFGAGGILIHAVKSGAEVYTASATRGEVGEISSRSDATPETLPQVREAEYRAAGRAMGVTRSDLLGYRDSGMAGTEENRDPQAFMNQPKEQVIGQILDLFDELRPHVVVTFEPGGAYGHPDHVLISACTLEAVRRRQSNPGEGWAPQKLYYFVFPQSRMRKWIEQFREHDPDSDFANIDPDILGVPDETICLEIDTLPYDAQWRDAIAAHRSQYSPLDRLSEDLQRDYLAVSYLVRALPEWDGVRRESDLFEGVEG